MFVRLPVAFPKGVRQQMHRNEGLNPDFSTENPVTLRLGTAKGLLNLSRKENVSQTLSSSTSGLNPLPFKNAKCGLKCLHIMA